MTVEECGKTLRVVITGARTEGWLRLEDKARQLLDSIVTPNRNGNGGSGSSNRRRLK